MSSLRAIDIALDTKIPEVSSGNLVVVPVVPTELTVARKGLVSHIGAIYDNVHKHSGEDKAVKKVFEFLSEDAEGFLSRARNLQNALNPERSTYSRAYAAAAIAYLIRGQEAYKAGSWPVKRKGNEERLLYTFKDVYRDDLTFGEYSEWAYNQSVRNEIYWKRQLESLRQTFYMDLLRRTIDESDHDLSEV